MLARTSGTYSPESLHTEGYIHCATQAQVEQVANFYYKGHKNLMLLEINEEKLKVEVKWEGEEHQKFPHIYGSIEIHVVEREVDWQENEQGLFEFPFKRVLH